MNNYPRQAIVTKYIAATNTLGSRIKAKCQRGEITIQFPEGTEEEAHFLAAKALCDKFVAEDGDKHGCWNPEHLLGGYIPNRGGYSYVFVICDLLSIDTDAYLIKLHRCNNKSFGNLLN